MQMTPLKGFLLMMALNVSFEVLENTNRRSSLFITPGWLVAELTGRYWRKHYWRHFMVTFGYLTPNVLSTEWHALRSNSPSTSSR